MLSLLGVNKDLVWLLCSSLGGREDCLGVLSWVGHFTWDA